MPPRNLPCGGCSDPSAGAVALSICLSDPRRAVQGLSADPAIALEAASMALAPMIGVAAALLLFRRQRTQWVSRNFSSAVNFSLVSLRPSASGRPLLTLRTLSERRLDQLVDNDYGRSQVTAAARAGLRAAGQDVAAVRLVLMPDPASAQLLSNVLLNAVSEMFATGWLQLDAGCKGVVCVPYGVGLVCSTGPAGGTKLRVFLASKNTLMAAVRLRDSGEQPIYEHQAHSMAYHFLIQLAKTLEVNDATSLGASQENQKAQGARELSKPLSASIATPVATWLELCIPTGH